MKRLHLFLVLFLVGALLPGVPAAQNQAQDQIENQIEEGVFTAAVDEQLASGEYQTQLPKKPELPDIDPPSIPPWVGTFFTIVFWTLFGVIVLFILYQVFRYFQDRISPPQESPEVVRPTPLQPGKGPAPLPSLAEVDAMAKDGRFGDAIHFLLLIAIERLFKRLNKTQPKSKTSREILRDPGLIKAWRENLSVLVDAVEASLFAGKKITAVQYQACRKRFDVLTGAIKELKA